MAAALIANNNDQGKDKNNMGVIPVTPINNKDDKDKNKKGLVVPPPIVETDSNA